MSTPLQTLGNAFRKYPAGTYQKDGWRFVARYAAEGSRSEEFIGQLTRDGAPVEAAEGSTVTTPLGRFALRCTWKGFETWVPLDPAPSP